jgi:hypothetical protein
MERPASNGGFQTLNLSGSEFESEPARVEILYSNEVPRFIPFGELQRQGQWATVPAAPRAVRTCPQGRARASRGKSPRRRGSRRGAVATRAGPDSDSGDPEPGSSSGHLDRFALAGGPA